jgi:hypothetical protein
MESTKACTDDEQAHTLEWAYGCSALSAHTQEHNRMSSRAIASDAATPPASSDPGSAGCGQDPSHEALPNVERRS